MSDVRKYTMEEIFHIAIIDKYEELFWRNHEIMTGKELTNNENMRKKSIIILREHFKYTDGDIRESCRDYFKTVRKGI